MEQNFNENNTTNRSPSSWIYLIIGLVVQIYLILAIYSTVTNSNLPLVIPLGGHGEVALVIMFFLQIVASAFYLIFINMKPSKTVYTLIIGILIFFLSIPLPILLLILFNNLFGFRPY